MRVGLGGSYGLGREGEEEGERKGRREGDDFSQFQRMDMGDIWDGMQGM